MQARELAAEIGATTDSEVEVSGVTHNSRWVTPGDAFVALPGHTHDGHVFVADAVARGAVLVIGEGLPEGVACPVPYVTVPHGRKALAAAAAAVSGHPSRDLTVVGVTGTDGKTTTSLLALHLLRSAGISTGLISTIGYQLPDGVLRQPPEHFTTPEAPQVQQILREVRDAHAAACVLESSSHALALERVGCVDFDVSVWTHLTSEHLDFHGTVENYFRDKARLVERAPFAVLNADDPWTTRLRGVAPDEVTYGVEHDADWRAQDVVQAREGLTWRTTCPLGELACALPMIGSFNVANALAAMAVAARLGATGEQIVAGLATFAGVPGRMQQVPSGDGDPRVVVDFAHTPPSLEKALETIRATTDGELWVVIGSAGGPRDPSKRAPLGEVATRCADHAVFTEEDHRSTPLQEILDEMARGAAGRSNFELVGDRRAAIRRAITAAGPHDTVVLAGKGPEETLERDTETIDWDEVAEARLALALR